MLAIFVVIAGLTGRYTVGAATVSMEEKVGNKNADNVVIPYVYTPEVGEKGGDTTAIVYEGDDVSDTSKIAYFTQQSADEIVLNFKIRSSLASKDVKWVVSTLEAKALSQSTAWIMS